MNHLLQLHDAREQDNDKGEEGRIKAINEVKCDLCGDEFDVRFDIVHKVDNSDRHERYIKQDTYLCCDDCLTSDENNFEGVKIICQIKETKY